MMSDDSYGGEDENVEVECKKVLVEGSLDTRQCLKKKALVHGD